MRENESDGKMGMKKVLEEGIIGESIIVKLFLGYNAV